MDLVLCWAAGTPRPPPKAACSQVLQDSHIPRHGSLALLKATRATATPVGGTAVKARVAPWPTCLRSYSTPLRLIFTVKEETPATCLPRHKPDSRPVTPAVITKVSAITVCVTAAGHVIGSLPPATPSATTE